jgi:hypothetical protein
MDSLHADLVEEISLFDLLFISIPTNTDTDTQIRPKQIEPTQEEEFVKEREKERLTQNELLNQNEFDRLLAQVVSQREMLDVCNVQLRRAAEDHAFRLLQSDEDHAFRECDAHIPIKRLT